MFIINNMLRLGMLKEVDKFLEENPKYIISLNDKNFEKFVRLYLNNSFDEKMEEPFCIFSHIWYGADNFENINKILIESKYFNSLPESSVLDALYDLWNNMDYPKTVYAPFIKYLISKINDPKILLKEDLSDLTLLFDVYQGLGLEEKLLELNDVKLMSDILEDLDNSASANYLKILSKSLSLDQIKNLYLNCKTTIPAKSIFDIILGYHLENHKQELDALYDVISSNKKSPNYFIDLKKKRKINYFKECIDEITERKEITAEDKNYLASKLVASKNYPQMLDWISNIDCEANKQIIDCLVGNTTEFIILCSLSKQFIPYALEKILEQGEVNSSGVSPIDAIFFGEYDLEKLNFILDTLYEINPNVKLSKEITLKLLKLGVNKFAQILFIYELSSEERMDILNSLKAINSDWLIIYGVYLISGDKENTFDSKKGEEIISNIRTRKKTIEM